MPLRQPDPDRILTALGDPTRRSIVEALSTSPASVSHLAGAAGVTLTAIGQHLQVLEECGLARTEKTGRVRTCRLAPEGFAVLEAWITERKSLLERQLDRLGEILAEDNE